MKREHFEKRKVLRVSRSLPVKEKHLWHGNMPNIRIASSIRDDRYDLYVEACSLSLELIAFSSEVGTVRVKKARQTRNSAWKFAMAQDPSQSLPPAAAESAAARKPLTPAAQRALAEAQARRLAAEANAGQAAREFQGPKGPEPTRYGDWESKGIASDF